MRLQIASDLHLESRPKQTFETILIDKICDVLVLLGDIAPLDHPNLGPFLEWCSKRWKTILYVPGKLECSYMHTVLESVVCLKERCSPFKNIHVLYRDLFYSEDGLIILGCPFWTFSPTQPKWLRTLHREDLAWIKEITTIYTNPCIVLSHFGPVEWLQAEKGPGDPSDTPTTTETELLLREPIVAWVFGNCHSYVEYSKSWSTANGTPRSIILVCNGMGRPGEIKEPFEEYRKDAVLAIDPRRYL